MGKGGSSRERYDREFKLEAIRLFQKAGVTDRAVERDLGLYQGALRHWKQELGARGEDAFPGIGHLPHLEEENRRLRRELANARMERDILKKAVAIFTVPPKTGTNS